MPRRTLITGGAGFIGSHLAELLRSRGDAITIIDDLSTGREANLAHLIGGDCTFIRGRVGDVLRASPQAMAGVDRVYHLAASVGVQLVVSDPGAIIRNNIEETANVIDAARRAGAAVLVASSSEVYGKSEDLPLREDGDIVYGPTTGPRWSYAMSKALDEHLALAYDAQVRVSGGASGGGGGARASAGAVVVRLFNTIGPRQVGHYGMVVPRFVRAALRHEDLTIYGDGNQTRAFCDVRDVVRAMAALMDDTRHYGQVFNVGSDIEVTINELADRVIALTGSRSRKRHISFDEAYAPGFEDPFKRRVPDVSKVRAAIGWQPRITLEATLRELIAG